MTRLHFMPFNRLHKIREIATIFRLVERRRLEAQGLGAPINADPEVFVIAAGRELVTVVVAMDLGPWADGVAFAIGVGEVADPVLGVDYLAYSLFWGRGNFCVTRSLPYRFWGGGRAK